MPTYMLTARDADNMTARTIGVDQRDRPARAVDRIDMPGLGAEVTKAVVEIRASMPDEVVVSMSPVIIEP